MPSTYGRAVACFALAACLGSVVVAVQAADPHPGQAPYDRVCKVCHGAEGIGNAGPRLVPFTMDLDELMVKVREGGGEMPPVSQNRLSDDEVKLIAAYLKSLSPPDAAAAEAPTPGRPAR